MDMMGSRQRVDISTHDFYALVDIYQDVHESDYNGPLRTYNNELRNALRYIREDHEGVKELYQRFMSEADKSMKRRTDARWGTHEEQKDAYDRFKNTLGGNFLSTVYHATAQMADTFEGIATLVDEIQTSPLMLSGERIDLEDLSSFSHENMQRIAYEIQVNQDSLSQFIGAVGQLYNGRALILNSLQSVISRVGGYYESLVRRHSQNGVEIFNNPMVTDVAYCIYENVDGHGEIESGVDPDEISAYTIQKAQVLTDASTKGIVGRMVREPDNFLGEIRSFYELTWETYERLFDMFEEPVQEVRSILMPFERFEQPDRRDLERLLSRLDSLDPRDVKYNDPGTLRTSEEQYAYNFRRETISTVVDLLEDEDTQPRQMVEYILNRKAKFQNWKRDENSFYKCKIGTGNQFTGKAPGALEVVPGDKPSVNLDEIIGSGYDEIRDYIDQIESSAQFHDLFVASSPSRSADKNNVLLIGPQGCGKTEVLRAVGGDARSISVFAQGSDFNTCWLGEAQKNPKRMFEEGRKLQKESGKHVHFLIDEIDSVLNDDKRAAGKIDLTLEFQVLMDGVVRYPGLSVWGTTNNPERIPVPMIRRFSKVAVVGELSLEDRVQLLKHFAGFMPHKVSDEEWADFAERLDGATGDIIRKIVDTVWREKMTNFVHEKPEKAKALTEWLNDGTKFDVSEFDGDRREEFKTRLGNHVVIDAKSVSDSVDRALDNMAIVSEIETAKRTYDQARKFLDSIRKN